MTDVVTYRPDPKEFAWTFGGVAPVRTVKPGDVLELWTEDAFGGKVRGPDDIASRVPDFRFVNPQTGPFFGSDQATRSSWRFDFGMDGCTGIDGWYVDDVTVSQCSATLATKDDAAS